MGIQTSVLATEPDTFPTSGELLKQNLLNLIFKASGCSGVRTDNLYFLQVPGTTEASGLGIML